MGEHTTTTADRRVAELEAALAVATEQVAALTKERDALRASHMRLREELELLKRRIFVAKAERVDTAQLEMEFAEKLRRLDALAGTLEDVPSDEDDGGKTDKKKHPKKSTGRRDLKKLALEEERVEISDPLYERLVEEGKATRISFEESCKLAYKRGGLRRLVIARVKYQVTGNDGETAIDTAPIPPETFPRSLAAPSLLAHVIMLKYGQGMPLFRIEDGFARDGCPVDRGTMCRWVEDAGATCGATVVHAARQEALATAFCIATDATGVLVQPIRTHEKVRQACRRGHYFVHIADRDHIFFDYTSKETSKAVAAMFTGFSGYVQADAKSVYDVLFCDPDERPPDEDDDGATRHEVGCLAHARRKFWEAAIAKNDVAREALARLSRIFELDASWRGRSPAEIKRLRDAHLKPHLQAFFAWTEIEFDKVREQRGSLRSALGYAVRQKDALLRVLDDGRLVLDNNRSERALRGSIATGRKAWLFVGSDDHADSAGHLFSLIASCSCTDSTPRPTCATCSASWLTGPKVVTSSSRHGTGPAPARGSTPTSSRARSGRSPSRRTSPRRPNRSARRTPWADDSALTPRSCGSQLTRARRGPCSGYLKSDSGQHDHLRAIRSSGTRGRVRADSVIRCGGIRRTSARVR